MKMIWILAFISGTFCVSCQKNDLHVFDESYQPDTSPSRFTHSTIIDNPYFPALENKTYRYEGQTPDGYEVTEETRLNITRTVQGIECIIVRFRAFVDNVLVEETDDWYAQDDDGNVWYFGEHVITYNSDGTISNHDGSWEAGVDGAKAGMIMPADPQVGSKYREEYYFNEAEDEAEVIGTGLSIIVPYGSFSNCIETRNWSVLEPDVIEHKFYAPGIGLVKELEHEENAEIKLISIH